MAKFFVRIPVQTRIEFFIEADSEDEAVKNAEALLGDPEADRSDWEVIEKYRALGRGQIAPLWNSKENDNG